MKRYANGEINVVWQANLCNHSGHCYRELPSVFNMTARPWVNVRGASTEAIVAQVERCPTAALTWERCEECGAPAQVSVEVRPGGPLIVRGDIHLKTVDGTEPKTGVFAFCRCGASDRQPWCDGNHRRLGFEG